MKIDFVDAWIMQSIYHAENKNGAALKDIIAYADYVNHAILTFEELTKALKNLGMLGLVIQDENKLKTSSEFKKWWTKNFKEKKRIYVQKELTEIEKYLNKRVAQKEEQQAIEIVIQENEFNNAVDGYTRQMNDLLKK